MIPPLPSFPQSTLHGSLPWCILHHLPAFLCAPFVFWPFPAWCTLSINLCQVFSSLCSQEKYRPKIKRGHRNSAESELWLSLIAFENWIIFQWCDLWRPGLRQHSFPHFLILMFRQAARVVQIVAMVLDSCQGLRTSLLSLVCLIVKGNVRQPCVRSSSITLGPGSGCLPRCQYYGYGSNRSNIAGKYFRLDNTIRRHYSRYKNTHHKILRLPSSIISKTSLQDNPSKVKVVRVRIFDTLH